MSRGFRGIVKEHDFMASIIAERRITLIHASFTVVCSVVNSIDFTTYGRQTSKSNLRRGRAGFESTGLFFPYHSCEMADLLRSATSGSNWTTKELLAFNIRVVDATVSSFFGSTELPPVSVSPIILNNLHIPVNGHPSKIDRHFFQYLKAAEQASSEDSAVADFAALILTMLDYDDEDRFIRLRKEILFYMAGQKVDAKADVCVMNDLGYLLLVQEDKVSLL